MMGLRIKNAIHQRYGLEYTREQCEARSRYIELKPDAAIGGARNADAELRSLRIPPHAVQWNMKLLPQLETMLSATWRLDGPNTVSRLRRRPASTTFLLRRRKSATASQKPRPPVRSRGASQAKYRAA